ncbi:hypothetical protein BUALT_Bualt10G0080000 [Buddleja alternifolia]|uniref:Uncharacterized protein n=1 Tax=Buddleja alternifolia TaxID=168488 RepID=A0AAV6WYE8_9LAMI|nr:hypothetical protein BUALT_Bualt10G0080000 [Buddleja alternifolia]
MESMLGFKDPLVDDVVEEEKSHSLKVVPWISWDEWKFVKDSLFCSSPHSVVASALRRVRIQSIHINYMKLSIDIFILAGGKMLLCNFFIEIPVNRWLYSSFSPAVVYVMLEYLLSALGSSNLVDHVEDSQSVHGTENKQTAYDDWTSVVF